MGAWGIRRAFELVDPVLEVLYKLPNLIRNPLHTDPTARYLDFYRMTVLDHPACHRQKGKYNDGDDDRPQQRCNGLDHLNGLHEYP
ncbi:hypothetical protein Prum_058410 [Phytohabitans rumicis]|uniref:Uncharacterized protein n=1 Tax=Phytohabitans rumicis TaxID=1076125 RepID=A0A6V8LC82_9ACTN|nr:hypothetical protein Prum_058410 [Phytohabitans rumicis]